jgi:hypothetical protein
MEGRRFGLAPSLPKGPRKRKSDGVSKTQHLRRHMIAGRPLEPPVKRIQKHRRPKKRQ